MVALVYLLVTLIFSRVVFYIEQGMSRQDKEKPVSLMHRLAGGVVDFVVLDFLGLIVYGLIQTVALIFILPSPYLILLFVMLIFSAVYILFFWTRAGRTPGMMAVGLRLANEEGAHPTLGQALMRLLFLILPLPGLSLLWMQWSSTGEPLHDRFARTHVGRD